MYHPERVSDWLHGKDVYPINMEVCLIGACNHRCIFCGCDYMQYKPYIIPMPTILKVFDETYPKGLRSVLFAGSGEPLLHPDFATIVNKTKEIGIDIAVSTNGALFKPSILDQCLKDISWVRFSVSAGTEARYKTIHRGRDGDLQRVFDNIEYAANLKAKNNYDVVLNVQIVMIPDNVDEIVLLAKEVKARGADRFVVKSYGDNFSTENTIKKDITLKFFNDNQGFRDELMSLNDNKFEALYRQNRINAEFSEHHYGRCYGSSFYVCICADGNVCPCCNLQGMEEYYFGNINEQSFEEIWKSERHAQVMKRLEEINLLPCPHACRLDSINRFLDGLVHPDKHINFI